nr:DUF4219 domain-containing protein/UBN2 domain-containing protein [Tanacetum cinerariifolium]
MILENDKNIVGELVVYGNYKPTIRSKDTGKKEVIPYEKYKEFHKKMISKNDKAKMVLYNALRKKEYERIFMCNMAKDVWNLLIITHQGNKKVKDNKIDLFVQKYKEFVIFDDETIDYDFARFNTIITSLKALDESFSSRNHVRKFLRAFPTKWRPKVTATKESKDLSTLPLDELVSNLKVYEVVLEKDSKISISKKKNTSYLHSKHEKFQVMKKYLTRRSGDEEYAMAAFVVGCWSDSAEDSKKEEIYLMALDNNEVHIKVKLEPDEWIKDSGCSRHMTGNKDLFSTYKAIDGGNVVFGNNTKSKIIEKETMRIEEYFNVRFDESPPPKSSPLVDDDIVESQIIENQIEDMEIKENKALNKEIVNIKESKDHPIDLVIGDNVDHKTTSGVCTFMGCCLTSWFSKKQTALAISTIEAEYVFAEKACQQSLWMKQALVDYDIKLDDMPILCDNKVPPLTPNISPPLSPITSSGISLSKLLTTLKLTPPPLTSPPPAPTQPSKHSSPLAINFDPVELIFLTPPTSSHAFFDSLKYLPPKTTNPPPPRPSFESIEHLANQPPPLPAIEPPLPPQLPHLPPQLPPLGPNNPFPMLTHEMFYVHCQHTQVIFDNLRDEMRFIFNHILDRLNVLAHFVSRSRFHWLTVAVVVKDFYKKFYNSLGRVPNRCSSSMARLEKLRLLIQKLIPLVEVKTASANVNAAEEVNTDGENIQSN